MEKTDTFSPETRQSIYNAQNGICKNCLDPIDKAFGFHHMLINSKPNQAKFPLFLHSPMNCVGLCEKCHTNKPHLFRISEKLARVYENWLSKYFISL